MFQQIMENIAKERPAQEPAKSFRKLHMGMSIEEVKAIETGTLVDYDDGEYSDDKVQILCYCYYSSVSIPYHLYLYFHEDKLFKANLVHDIAQSELGTKYTQILKKLCQKYGAISKDRIFWKNNYYQKQFELGYAEAIQIALCNNHANISHSWNKNDIVVVLNNYRNKTATELRVCFFDTDILGNPFLRAC